jgi:hypothetical protein
LVKICGLYVEVPQNTYFNSKRVVKQQNFILYIVKPAYNIISLYDTSFIASGIVWYLFTRHC